MARGKGLKVEKRGFSWLERGGKWRKGLVCGGKGWNVKEMEEGDGTLQKGVVT